MRFWLASAELSKSFSRVHDEDVSLNSLPDKVFCSASALLPSCDLKVKLAMLS